MDKNSNSVISIYIKYKIIDYIYLVTNIRNMLIN